MEVYHGDSQGCEEFGFAEEEAKEGEFPVDFEEDEAEIEDEDSDVSFEENNTELSNSAIQEE